MKNILLLVAGFAMCGTVTAIPDYGVTTESVIVVDVGHELAVTAEMLVPGYEYTLTSTGYEFLFTVSAEGIGSGWEFECPGITSALENAEILLDPGRICSEANSTSDSDNSLTGLTPLNTDLAFRKARDGLSC